MQRLALSSPSSFFLSFSYCFLFFFIEVDHSTWTNFLQAAPRKLARPASIWAWKSHQRTTFEGAFGCRTSCVSALMDSTVGQMNGQDIQTNTVTNHWLSVSQIKRLIVLSTPLRGVIPACAIDRTRRINQYIDTKHKWGSYTGIFCSALRDVHCYDSVGADCTSAIGLTILFWWTFLIFHVFVSVWLPTDCLPALVAYEAVLDAVIDDACKQEGTCVYEVGIRE